MKKRKPDYIFITCILLFAFTAIRCTDGIKTDPKNLIGRWRREKVIHQGKTISKPDPSQWRYEAEVEFLKDGKIEGTLSYDTFTGDYTTSDMDSITFNSWADTKKGDSDWALLFL